MKKSRRDLGLLLPGRGWLSAATGDTVLNVLQHHGAFVSSACGGRGTCGKCRVRYLTEVPEPTQADRAAIEVAAILAGWRLACQHEVHGSATIELPTISELPHKATIDGLDLLPAKDPCGCSEDDDEGLGLAIDIGTTTIAVHLFDLRTGCRLAGAASRNPQIPYGADVISRIAHVRRHKESGLSDLHDALIGGLNRLIVDTTDVAAVSAEAIRGAAAVGNPTMLHLLLSVDPSGIGVSPFEPAFSRATAGTAEEIGLRIRSDAIVRTLPGISGYVGADVIAGVLATNLADSSGAVLFLDIGTNGEIVLAIDGRLTSCSTAAGPAFEGASIVQGMPAMEGAIDTVRMEGTRIVATTIGDSGAIGICGTGLLSAVAELVAAGAIDRTGRLVRSGTPLDNRLLGDGAERRLQLSDGDYPVYLYQRDVREVQLAKGAIRSGIEILLRRAEVAPAQIDRVLIAGAFSSALAAEHLVTIGLLPEIQPTRVENIGQAAVRGSALALLNQGLFAEADRVAQSVEVVELSAEPEFSSLFVESMAFSGNVSSPET